MRTNNGRGFGANLFRLLGLSTGAIVAIVLVALVAVCALVALALYCLTRRRRDTPHGARSGVRAYENYDEVGASDMSVRPSEVADHDSMPRSSITDADDKLVAATMKQSWVATRKHSRANVKKQAQPSNKDQSIIDMALYNQVTPETKKKASVRDQSIVDMSVYSAVADRESFRAGLKDK